MAGQRSNPVLKGYKVLDLTTFLSGPFCTQVLADLGADVVKIESPAGDSSRHIPPHFVGEDSAYFLANNRNKRSVAVDLKSKEGQALVLDLIAKADVVVDNYRPGVLQRLNIDPAKICAAHPALIWASISGFGQNGPWKDRPAYDMIVQAESGVMSLTGEPDRPSVRLGIPAGDTVAGLYATIAINAALANRERSGLGQMIDVSMLDCQLAMLSYQSAYALIAGVTPGPQGARHDSIPTYRSFVARDGRQVVITANTTRMWEGLCAALDMPDLATDPRFVSGRLRLENKDALWGILEPAFLARDAKDWVGILEDADVPVALIKSVPEALDDARTYGRGMITQIENGTAPAIDVVGNPIKFAGHAAPVDRYPPTLGGDLQSVLADWLNDDVNAEPVSAE
jgi:crotonobetainyl-CoA:carnitine CoA-transferase CaiB-like acyl-CoA transferase